MVIHCMIVSKYMYGWEHSVTNIIAHLNTFPASHNFCHRECSGSVVECLTGDKEVAGSSLTGITALCP